MNVFDDKHSRVGACRDKAQESLKASDVIAAERQCATGGSGNVPQRQQYFGSCEILAGAPIRPRTSRVIGNKSPRQRRLAGPGFSCECNDSSPTQGRQLKCALQPGKLFVAFKQIGIETGHESQSDSVAARDRPGTVMPPT